MRGPRAALSIAITAVSLLGTAAVTAEHPAARLSGSETTYTLARGDTLKTVAARFGIDPETIATENRLEPGRPLETGRQLRIDNRHIVPALLAPGEIVVNVPQRMAFFDAGGYVVGYPIAVGRATWQTPAGSFSVVRKEEDPAWHVPASIRAEGARHGHVLPLVVQPGPRNPLGRFWIGLSISGIGIHGTPIESSVYQAATHGCMRLQHDRIADLYSRVDLGTRGRIIYEPVLMTAGDNEVYLEVHPDVYRRLPKTPHEVARDLAVSLGIEERVDWGAVDREIELHAGVARRVSNDR
jgi:L,D-transpeptidase ErfK/SrfK